MTAPIHDGELARAYASDGAESAFRALVARHLDLVFATALRQVGDRQMAEEITQNVFVALARKAPALAHYETLAGWLHRTTVLESKARIRSELRHKQREQIAAELAQIQQHGEPALRPLIPLLDEALLYLREPDRLALICRFFEDQNLREIGARLGIDEDAARKRVSRALERLTQFFRQRGFALPAGTGIAVLFTAGAQAAPPALAASVVQAGLTAGSTAGVFSLLVNLMALSKMKVAFACLLAVSAPLLWQAKTMAHLVQLQRTTAAQVQEQEQNLASLVAERTGLRDSLRQATSERFAAESQLTALRQQRQGQLPPPRYQWDDFSPLVRIPKSFLDDMNVATFSNRQGEITPQIKEVLQLSRAEADQLQSTVDHFVAEFRQAQQQSMRYLPLPDDDPSLGTPEEKRSFEMGDVMQQFRAFRTEFYASTESLLGPDRFSIFRQGLSPWMPVDEEADQRMGRNSFESITPQAHELVFQKSSLPGVITMQVHVSSGYSSIPVAVEEIPEIFTPYLQDWITEATEMKLAQQPEPQS